MVMFVSEYYYHAILYFQTVDMFLLIPLYTVIIYIKSTNKIRFLLEYLCLFKYYRSRCSLSDRTASITPEQ
jgi:hypothetical protein